MPEPHPEWCILAELAQPPLATLTQHRRALPASLAERRYAAAR